MKKENICKIVKSTKNQRGITLVALLITIIVLIILASITVETGIESTNKTRLQAFYTKLEIIHKKVDEIASTNESYIDSNGNVVYMKQIGKELTSSQRESLQKIIQSENLRVQVESFKYFTKQDLNDMLELLDIDYNVFIDFEHRIVVVENGVKIGNETYYVLKNNTHYINPDTNKNTGVIQSLSYQVTKYGTDRCKVVVTPSNTIGDIVGIGHVEYKETTSRYWEISPNNEMILKTSTKYNLVYQDLNKNKIEKVVNIDAGGTPNLTEE